jgi:uncharacterized protein YukE
VDINGWIDGKVLEILQACGVELPGGDGDALRSIAGGWDAMGDELIGITKAIDNAISSADQHDWSGPARTAFEQHWQIQAQAIDQMGQNLHQVASGLRSYADEIDSINKAIIDICVQIAEMEVGGLLLSFVTAGISDLVANTAVVAKVAEVIDLVKVFSAAAEKVAQLLEDFLQLGEETAATLEKVLAAVAKFGAGFLKKGLESFVTNFVADSGSMMANQALNGQPVTVGTDLASGAWDAGGTALFTAGAGSLAGGVGATGRVAQILNGEGLMGTTVNGAVGNVVGGVTMDLANHQDLTTIGEDALTNAATGATGNAASDRVFNAMEGRGSLGGENRSERAKLADAAFKNTFGTGLNTALYTAGSGIESDAQTLSKDTDPSIETKGGQ